MSIIYPFPPFSGYTWNTPVIPKLYWDVYSQEQRLKTLCMEYAKLIAYNSDLADTLNNYIEIVNTLEEKLPELVNEEVKQEVQELVTTGQFAEMVQEAIATLTEELNQKIEDESINRFNADNALQAQIDDLNKKRHEMKVSMLNSYFALTLCQANNCNVVFDCGYSVEASRIVDFFESHNVTEIDILVITHFHGDHYDGIATVLDYCTENTNIYIQMPTPETNYDYSAYTLGYSTVLNAITAKGFKPFIVPNEGETITIKNVDITFYNTDSNNVSVYEDSWGNSGNALTEKRATLNNYSLITKVEYFGNVYIDTGDIEGAAQQIYENKLGNATVAKNPHHFDNRMGRINFFKNINPKIWIASNNIKPYTDTTVNEYSYQQCYLSRYIVWESDTTPFLANVGKEINITCTNGTPTFFDGYECAITNYLDTQQRLHYSMCLPPAYYNECPFALSLIINTEIMANEITYIARRSNPLVFGIGYDENLPLSKELYDLFKPYPTTNQIYFTLGNVLFEAQYMYAYYSSPILKLEPGFTLSEPNRRIVRTSNGGFWYGFDVENNEINAEDWTFIKNARILQITFDNNVIMPVVQNFGTDNESTGETYMFSGVKSNSDFSALYSVIINSDRSISAKIISIASGATSDINVSHIRVID